MRRLVFSFLILLSFVGELKAADRDVLRQIYREVPRQYIAPIKVEDIAILMLKGSMIVDKQLKVGDDNDKVSLYYKGKLVKSLYKPKKKNSVNAWVDLSAEILDLAAEKSPKAMKHDFELPALGMLEAVKKLDGDSKFYLNPEAMKDRRLKHKRNFAERMIDDVLYIKILAFNAYTEQSVKDAVEKNTNAKGLILDLRGSPGGMLSAAVAVSDLFLDDGIMASVSGRDGVVYYDSTEGDIFEGKPIIILIDGQTASSAEVLTAALQEQARAKVVGTNSLGKGSVQKLISLSDGATLSLTNAYFYTPSGLKLHKKGVLPNVCTFEMQEGKDISKLLALSENRMCPSEERAEKGLDVDVAREMLAGGDFVIKNKK